MRSAISSTRAARPSSLPGLSVFCRRYRPFHSSRPQCRTPCPCTCRICVRPFTASSSTRRSGTKPIFTTASSRSGNPASRATSSRSSRSSTRRRSKRCAKRLPRPSVRSSAGGRGPPALSGPSILSSKASLPLSLSSSIFGRRLRLAGTPLLPPHALRFTSTISTTQSRPRSPPPPRPCSRLCPVAEVARSITLPHACPPLHYLFVAILSHIGATVKSTIIRAKWWPEVTRTSRSAPACLPVLFVPLSPTPSILLHPAHPC